jgi:hypothetical protein
MLINTSSKRTLKENISGVIAGFDLNLAYNSHRDFAYVR